MSIDVRRLVDDHHALWRRFADSYVDARSWEELARSRETSHLTIANVTMHAVNMEDWWLHHLVPGKPWSGPPWDGFRDAASMRERVLEVEEKTRRLLRDTKDDDLRRPCRVHSQRDRRMEPGADPRRGRERGDAPPRRGPRHAVADGQEAALPRLPGVAGDVRARDGSDAGRLTHARLRAHPRLVPHASKAGRVRCNRIPHPLACLARELPLGELEQKSEVPG